MWEGWGDADKVMIRRGGGEVKGQRSKGKGEGGEKVRRGRGSSELRVQSFFALRISEKVERE